MSEKVLISLNVQKCVIFIKLNVWNTFLRQKIIQENISYRIWFALLQGPNLITELRNYHFLFLQLYIAHSFTLVLHSTDFVIKKID